MTFLENEILKFHDFPGFPGPVRTLYTDIEENSNDVLSLWLLAIYYGIHKSLLIK